MMNKLDRIHETGIKSEFEYSDMAKKSAEITTDIAIKFAEWITRKYPDKNRNYLGEMLHAESKYDGADTTSNLFQEFINDYYSHE